VFSTKRALISFIAVAAIMTSKTTANEGINTTMKELRAGVGGAEIVEATDRLSILSNPQTQKQLEIAFRNIEGIVSSDETRMQFRAMRPKLQAITDGEEKAHVLGQLRSLITNQLLARLSLADRRTFVLGYDLRQAFYNATTLRDKLADAQIRSRITATEAADANVEWLRPIRLRLGSFEAGDFSNVIATAGSILSRLNQP